MLLIEDAELAFLSIESQFQFTKIEDGAVLISQNWNQNFSLQFILQWLPVDIEKFRIAGGLPIFQHVQPPAVVASHHPHVIGHDVENVSHTMLAQSRHELFEIFCASNLRIQQVVIDDVVSMSASWTCSEIRRGITMRDAQGGQVRN